MYTQMGGWCLTTSGAKVLVYMVLPIPMIILIALSPIPYLCMPLILNIICLQKQPHPLNLLHYLTL